MTNKTNKKIHCTQVLFLLKTFKDDSDEQDMGDQYMNYVDVYNDIPVDDNHENLVVADKPENYKAVND